MECEAWTSNFSVVYYYFPLSTLKLYLTEIYGKNGGGEKKEEKIEFYEDPNPNPNPNLVFNKLKVFSS